MEARKFWNVLIVDDEPDVHEVTDYALKRESIFGAKLKLHHAKSTAEAKEFFERNDAAAALAVAFIDVVMESDDAGLELCRWIREDRQEQVTQLILRTGQPGKAPPRKIIDDYDISGYLTKAEASSDRLYMVLKTAIQEYYNLQYLFWSAELYDLARARAADPADLFNLANALLSQPTPEALGFEFHRGMDFFGRRYIGQGAFLAKSEFDRVAPALLERGADQLDRNGIATIDRDVVVQARVMGTGEVATMIVRDATIPRGLGQVYGSVWRQKLAYLAEIFHRIG